MTCRAPGLAGTLMRGHQPQSLRYRTWELSDLNRGAGESRTQFGRLSPLADQDRPPHTPRGLHGCENKGVARQGICKYVKTKGGCGWQAPSAQRKKGRFLGFGPVHPCGDRKYAQSSEGTGDRDVTWRM